jgi:hypothetical protein
MFLVKIKKYIIMNKRPNQKVRFREPSKTLIGKFFSFFGIEVNRKYNVGYFHQTGYSGKQRNDQHDIVIIEKEDGCVVTVPKKEKYYKLIF